MPDPNVAPALRTARAAHGWSQAEAARELAALAAARGVSVAIPASLKTLLSRWENGHSVPEPQYRALLAELYGRSTAELGLDDARRPPAGEGLRAGIAAAAAVDDATVALWRGQLDIAHRLDAEFGAAGTAGQLRAQVEQLERTLLHCVTAHRRRAVAGVLADAASLSGTHALDEAAHEPAWRAFRTAHAAAVEAGIEGARIVAAAGLATVLVEVGEPASALALLDDDPPPAGPAAIARWSAARGLAAAAAGDGELTGQAFAAARAAAGSGGPGDPTVDVVHVRTRVEVVTADVDRWWGHALVDLGERGAVEPLHRALSTAPVSARDRAALHADLAVALADEQPARAAAHARTARDLATRIGSERVAARLVKLVPTS